MPTRCEPIPGDEANLHPALVSTALRWGRVGSSALAATLVHLVGSGELTARYVDVTQNVLGQPMRRRTIELALPGRQARSGQHRPEGARLIKDGYVPGLTRIDRCILSFIFDHVAHAPKVTLRDIRAFAKSQPEAYSHAILEWRDAVKDTADEHGLVIEHLYSGRAGDLRRLRREIRRSARCLGRVGSLSPLHSGQHRVLELAVALGYEPDVVRMMRFPRPRKVDLSVSAGIPDWRRWLHGMSARPFLGW
jgi:hypothetical protein